VDEDLIALVLGRTDAALGLLMSIMVAKGLISSCEMADALDKAAASVQGLSSGRSIATVFQSLKLLLTHSDASPANAIQPSELSQGKRLIQ
jgi:hypothetical protein